MRSLGCLLVLGVTTGLASPFGGWGPGEDYGHTGARPPRCNPNAVFGYDAFKLTNNRFNYRSGLKEIQRYCITSKQSERTKILLLYLTFLNF